MKSYTRFASATTLSACLAFTGCGQQVPTRAPVPVVNGSQPGLVIAASASAPSDRATAQQARFETRLCNEDRAVIETVLVSLLHDGEFRPNAPGLGDGPFDSVVLDDATVRRENENEIRNDLYRRGDVIPRDMLDSLLRRNTVSVSLTDLRPGNSSIVTADLRLPASQSSRPWRSHELPAAMQAILAKGHKPKGAVRISLPGYSADARSAVVRIYFAWSRHDASGTFVLKKLSNGWRIEWRDYIYHV